MNRLPEPPTEAPDADELLELYALDLLGEVETVEVERRLETDSAARERLRELRGVTAMLALELEPVEAAPDLKQRILQAARADIEQRAAPLVVSTRPAASPEPISLGHARAERVQRTAWPSRLGWAVAAVMALALAGSLSWNLQLRDELRDRPETIIFAVRGSEDAVGVRGEVLVIGDEGDTIVKLTGLPELERGKVYQVWLIADDTPAPDVTFVRDNSGLASVGVAGNVAAFDTLAITVEPVGGSSAPTSPPIIFSDLTTQS